MATTVEESNPPDLLSSIDSSPNMEHDQDPENDQLSAVNIYDADLLSKINSLHCPFIWKPEDSLRSYNQDSVEEIMNVDEIFDEPSGFKLRKYVIHLILCYNNFNKRLLEKSLKHLDEMEKMLLFSMKNRSQDVYFVQINDALFHILHSCRIVMFHTTNQKEKAHQILSKITPYEKLNDTNKAGIWAVRGNLYVEFGYEGIKAALQYIEKSTQIDDNNAYWHFMRGMYLGRLRRMESVVAIPTREEIRSLERAMVLKKDDASFMAFAAEVYVETASRSKKASQQMLLIANEQERRKLAEKNDLLKERAVMLFKRSVSLNKNSAHILFRCGKGMLKLTPPYQDVDLALEYLKKGLELSYESSFGNHAMALYYIKHAEDYDMARKYLVKATHSKNFGADIDLIRVNFLDNRDPEALLDSLLKLFDRYSDKMKHQKILAEIESYYLFINYNLMKAISYMKKLLYLVGNQDDIISVFKSGVLRHRFPVSLLDILLSDISDRSDKDSLSAEENEECRKFMQRLCLENITLPKLNKENLRKKIINDIKANFKDIDVSKANRLPCSTEKQPRKDYNPAEGRFEKEYARKYYAGDESSSKYQKTVVDEFFEKYEAAATADSKSKCSTNRKNSNGDAEAKSKDDSKYHPILQQLFDKVKNSPSCDSDENEEEKEIIDKLARKLNLHLSLSASAEISKRTSRSSNINVGASTSCQRDHFDAPDVHRRRSSRSPKRRSRSPEGYRSSKYSSYRRSDSRESYRSEQSRRKRSPSVESLRSNRHSARRRSLSRNRRSRSTSKDRRSRMNRSLSRERSVSSRIEKTSSRSKSRDHQKSSRRRSVSKNNKFSTRSNRVRSTSRGSRDSRTSRRRSISKETKYSSKSTRPRSTSRETRDRKSYRKRSVSRETKYSTRSNCRRSTSRETRKNGKSTRKRSVSRETKYSTRSNRHRSTSRGSRDDKPSRKRSVSKETKYSTRSDRRRSTSRESRKDLKSSRRRSNSRESKYSVRSSRRKSPSQERSPSKNERRRSRDRRSASKELGKRSQSSESLRSTHKRRSPSTESRKPSRRKDRSLSKESLRSSKSKHSHPERSPTEKRHGRRSQDGSNSKPIPEAKTRSRSRESRHSSKHSPRPERNERSKKSKKYESNDTSTESDSSDTDFERNESKSHRRNSNDDRRNYRRDRRRSDSSNETRSVRSKRSSSTEKSRSKRISSRDRRDRYRPKDHDRRRRKRNSSERSSTDRYSESSREEVDRDKRYSRHRKLSPDEDVSSKDRKSKKRDTDRVVSSRSRSVEKSDDKIPNDESNSNKGD